MQLTTCLVPTPGESNPEAAPNFWSSVAQKFSHFRSSFWPKQGSGTITQGLSGSITPSWQKTRTPPAKRRFSDAWLAQSQDRSPESTFRTTAVLLEYNQLGSPPPSIPELQGESHHNRSWNMFHGWKPPTYTETPGSAQASQWKQAIWGDICRGVSNTGAALDCQLSPAKLQQSKREVN